MNTEEPAFQAGVEELIHSYLSDITSYGEISETYDVITNRFTAIIEPHIRAAEERARSRALDAVSAEVEAMLRNVSSLQARTVWKSGYEGGLVALLISLETGRGQ